MGVSFEGSFLLRGQFLSHLDLTRAGLAPVYRQDIGTRPAQLERQPPGVCTSLLQAKAKRGHQFRYLLPLAPAQQEGEDREGTRKRKCKHENSESYVPLRLTPCCY